MLRKRTRQQKYVNMLRKRRRQQKYVNMLRKHVHDNRSM